MHCETCAVSLQSSLFLKRTEAFILQIIIIISPRIFYFVYKQKSVNNSIPKSTAEFQTVLHTLMFFTHNAKYN